MPDSNPCDGIKGQAREFCDRSLQEDPPLPSQGGGITDGASDLVKDMAKGLAETISELVAPKNMSAPQKPDDWQYGPFLWLGQHLSVAIFVCVVVVCALTAWQGAPRLKQLGASTGWTLVAVAGMASVPQAVMLLNAAVSSAFTAAFNSNEGTLFGAIIGDLEKGGDAGNPLAQLLIISALVVCMAFAGLVFLTRQLGVLVIVCMAPVVLASLARGGDTTAVKAWMNKLLGLLFTPFALLFLAPFVQLAGGSLVLDAVLLLAADVLMIRMIFHGIPWVGPRLAGVARNAVEARTTNPLVRAAMRAGVPDVYEQENGPRGWRTVPTPGRAVHQDKGVLLAAYGITQQPRPGRLTTASTIAQVEQNAARTAQITEARRQARADHSQRGGGAQPRTPGPASPPPGARPPGPAPSPAPAPTRPPTP
ncbi:hypothetical protein [Streptomyces salyersiae]|uniref:Integral membrane protein n=1 Tax=Streptomyces salyersiae TaxID=3075530 RepID=A0ABU2RX64_9ACTN|nr:hypothetical protein [Streptomyces sp. DSM 41770]MDT0432903.1 hypothetical protein [Streptomyces sp. DSM 41770]